MRIFTSGEKLPGWFKLVFKVGGPQMKWWRVSPRQCVERVLFLAKEKFPVWCENDGKEGVVMLMMM
jgi:hypothetical protein